MLWLKNTREKRRRKKRSLDSRERRKNLRGSERKREQLQERDIEFSNSSIEFRTLLSLHHS
jgi:hypothetical protein